MIDLFATKNCLNIAGLLRAEQNGSHLASSTALSIYEVMNCNLSVQFCRLSSYRHCTVKKKTYPTFHSQSEQVANSRHQLTSGNPYLYFLHENTLSYTHFIP